MQNRHVLIAALCLVSLIACGEPESEIAEPELIDPATETIVSETTMTLVETPEIVEPDELGTDAMPEQAPVADPTTAPKPAPTSTRTADPAPTPAKPAISQPSAETPATKPVQPPRAEPQPESPAPQPAATEPETAAPTTTASKRPKTHTVDKDGVLHAAGMETPVKKCGACHGKDLQGGRVGVSCFDCHDQQWE